MKRWTLANVTAVPGTGNRRRKKARWLRRPRNAAVKRAIVAVVGTLRGVTVPPSARDDIHRRPERCWKAHRMTRWHERTSL